MRALAMLQAKMSAELHGSCSPPLSLVEDHLLAMQVMRISIRFKRRVCVCVCVCVVSHDNVQKHLPHGKLAAVRGRALQASFASASRVQLPSLQRILSAKRPKLSVVSAARCVACSQRAENHTAH